jgi:hypothetical protein
MFETDGVTKQDKDIGLIVATYQTSSLAIAPSQGLLGRLRSLSRMPSETVRLGFSKEIERDLASRASAFDFSGELPSLDLLSISSESLAKVWLTDEEDAAWKDI